MSWQTDNGLLTTKAEVSEAIMKSILSGRWGKAALPVVALGAALFLMGPTPAMAQRGHGGYGGGGRSYSGGGSAGRSYSGGGGYAGRSYSGGGARQYSAPSYSRGYSAP